MGYDVDEINESLSMHKYDEPFAAYHLLAIKSTVYEMNEARSNNSLLSASRAPSRRTGGGGGDPAGASVNRTSSGAAHTRPAGIPRGRSTVSEQRTTPAAYNPPPRVVSNRAHYDYAASGTPSRDVVGIKRSPSNVESTPKDAPAMMSRSVVNRTKTTGYSDTESTHDSSRRESIKNTLPNAPVSNRFARMSSTRRAPSVDCEPNLIPPLAKMAELEISPSDNILNTASPETTRFGTNNSVDLGHQTPEVTTSANTTNHNPFSTPSGGRNPHGDSAWSSAPATRHASTRYTHSASTASKFPRQTPGRSTIHGGNVQDRIPDGAKTPVQAAPPPEKPVSTGRQNSRMAFFNKLSFKFTRR